MLAELNDPANRPFVLLATGSYIGEGFDCPALDALFLAFPLAFKGRIVQYVGRLLRLEDDKHSVEVHDYVDVAIPVLVRMHDKRRPAFRSGSNSDPALEEDAGNSRRTRWGSEDWTLPDCTLSACLTWK